MSDDAEEAIVAAVAAVAVAVAPRDIRKENRDKWALVNVAPGQNPFKHEVYDAWFPLLQLGEVAATSKKKTGKMENSYSGRVLAWPTSVSKLASLLLQGKDKCKADRADLKPQLDELVRVVRVKQEAVGKAVAEQKGRNLAVMMAAQRGQQSATGGGRSPNQSSPSPLCLFIFVYSLSTRCLLALYTGVYYKYILSRPYIPCILMRILCIPVYTTPLRPMRSILLFRIRSAL